MADLQTLLKTIPEGPQYQEIRDALARVARTFPEQMAEIDEARVKRFVSDVDSGARDDTQIRNDIFQYVVTPEVISERLGVSMDEANALVNQTGGAQFALNDRVDNAGELDSSTRDATYGAPLTILYGRKQQWYFDPATNKHYVSYGLPDSDLEVFFEAEKDQIDALFGQGQVPNNVIRTSLSELTARQNFTFGGNVTEMEGAGSFEQQYERAMAMGLDTEGLPEWVKSDQKALDLVFIGQTEGKSNTWIIEQIAKLPSFQQRFPNIDKLKALNLSTEDAIGAFLEFEGNLKTLQRQFGGSEETVTPDVVGSLMGQGYSLADVQTTFTTFKRMKDYQPALQAFNEVLAAQGQPPMTPEDQFEFLQGNAPQEIYDIYESSSFREEAVAAGLGDALTAAEAIELALQTPGVMTQESVAAGMREAAQLALRMRSQIDLGEFGLDIDDIIDLSLGATPRSGKLLSEVTEGLQRATQQGKAFVSEQRANPFTGFSSQGVAQQSSLGTLRQDR